VCNPRSNRPSRSGGGAGRDALPRDPRQHIRWSGPVYPPPMAAALRRVRRKRILRVTSQYSIFQLCFEFVDLVIPDGRARSFTHPCARCLVPCTQLGIERRQNFLWQVKATILVGWPVSDCLGQECLFAMLSKASLIIRATPIELWDRSRLLSGISQLPDVRPPQATGARGQLLEPNRFPCGRRRWRNNR
jgi:hypothetical protein